MVNKALVIGINYVRQDCELSGCVNDSVRFKQMLIKVYGYEEKNILHLNDGPSASKSVAPTYLNIVKGMAWLIDGVRAGDKLTLTYSGHGALILDDNSDEEADEHGNPGLDGVLCPSDFRRPGCIIVDDFIKSYLADKVPRGASLTMIIDACHSGTMVDLKFNIIPKKMPVELRPKILTTYTGYNDVLATYKIHVKQKPTKGTVTCISGCKDDQTSADTWANGAATGALTQSIVNVLNNNRYVIPLIKFLFEVQNDLKQNGYEQIAQASVGNLDDQSIMFRF